MTVLHGRHVGSLLSAWAVVFLLAAGLYWLEVALPALADIITPGYVVLILVMLIVTWKWFRERGRDHDRRHGDRRHRDRRTPLESAPDQRAPQS